MVRIPVASLAAAACITLLGCSDCDPANMKKELVAVDTTAGCAAMDVLDAIHEKYKGCDSWVDPATALTCTLHDMGCSPSVGDSSGGDSSGVSYCPPRRRTTTRAPPPTPAPTPVPSSCQCLQCGPNGIAGPWQRGDCPAKASNAGTACASDPEAFGCVSSLDEYKCHCPGTVGEKTEACSWMTPHDGVDSTVLCEDGTYLLSNWSCVEEGHGQRVKCPANEPLMCADLGCGAGQEYCCQGSNCDALGGIRSCQALWPQWGAGKRRCAGKNEYRITQHMCQDKAVAAGEQHYSWASYNGGTCRESPTCDSIEDGLGNDWAIFKKPAEACDESFSGNGESYRGCQTRTLSGKVCQRWDSQTPHTHTMQSGYPSAGLESNFCRNPKNDGDSMWCYTTDPGTRREFCRPKSDQAFRDCQNGTLLEPLSARTQHDHCGSCDDGYVLNDKACEEAECHHGTLLEPLSARNRHDDCGSCDDGYFLNDVACEAFEGDCQNGTLLEPQSARTQHDHCGSCDDGHFLNDTVCEAFEGDCQNGTLLPQSNRTQHDHCGSCDEWYFLNDTVCSCHLPFQTIENDMVCEDWFVINGKGNNDCPGGAKPLTSSECRVAATHYGHVFLEETESNYPAGCYNYNSGSSVYFNNHPDGRGHSLSAPICTKAANLGNLIDLLS